jgi:hypothetical protein
MYIAVPITSREERDLVPSGDHARIVLGGVAGQSAEVGAVGVHDEHIPVVDALAAVDAIGAEQQLRAVR